jgi:predicted DNA-binding transcriptional regulator AlpA
MDQSEGEGRGREGPLLWGKQAIATALDISQRTLEREIAAGRFPRPDRRVGRLPRWKPETVRRWIDGG